jgi:hypothetical protein
MPQDPTLLATCRGGSCVVVDLQAHPATACSDASECRLRTNACCECGGPVDDDHLVAIGTGGGFDALVCDPGIGCPECAPGYPPATFECKAGHCVIAKTGSGCTPANQCAQCPDPVLGQDECYETCLCAVAAGLAPATTDCKAACFG